MSASRPLKSRQRTYRRHCGTPGSGQFRTHAPQQTASSFITEGVDHQQLHSPDRTDAVCPGNGIRFAYRRFGKAGGVPIVFNLQYLGTMDYWDPAVTDGLARGLLVRVRWDLRCAGTSRAGPTSSEASCCTQWPTLSSSRCPTRPGRPARSWSIGGYHRPSLQ
jgi:hypothetical protein